MVLLNYAGQGELSTVLEHHPREANLNVQLSVKDPSLIIHGHSAGCLFLCTFCGLKQNESLEYSVELSVDLEDLVFSLEIIGRYN